MKNKTILLSIALFASFAGVQAMDLENELLRQREEAHAKLKSIEAELKRVRLVRQEQEQEKEKEKREEKYNVKIEGLREQAALQASINKVKGYSNYKSDTGLTLLGVLTLNLKNFKEKLPMKRWKELELKEEAYFQDVKFLLTKGAKLDEKMPGGTHKGKMVVEIAVEGKKEKEGGISFIVPKLVDMMEDSGIEVNLKIVDEYFDDLEREDREAVLAESWSYESE